MIPWLLLTVVGFAAPPTVTLPQPPFVRVWTETLDKHAEIIAVENDTVYCASGSALLALDAQTGTVQWRSLAGLDVVDAALAGPHLYATVRQGRHRYTYTLHAVDAVTGRSRQLAQLSEEPQRITADENHVFVLDRSARISAYDSGAGALRWSRSLPFSKREKLIYGELAIAGAALYAAAGDGDFGLNIADGRIHWFRPSKFAGLYAPIVVGGDVITHHGELRRLNVESGEIVWSAPAASSIVLATDVVIGVSDAGPFGRDAADGRLLWQNAPLDEDGMLVTSGRHLTAPSDGQSVWLREVPIAQVTKDGRQMWRKDGIVTGIAAHAANGLVITRDGLRILGYREGALPPLPDSDGERRQLATHLVSRFEQLDDAERRQLTDLAPFACSPLLQRYVAWAREYAAAPDGADTLPLYIRLSDALAALLATCRREDTGALLRARRTLSPRSEWRDDLDAILHERGDDHLYAPVIVAELRRLPRERRTDSTALDAVARSSHPAAVALMIDALRDPNAAKDWRRAAFTHLAATGGSAGVRLVKQARAGRASLPPWFERLELARLPKEQIVAVKQDRAGRTWMLFESDVLGNDSDLFIAARTPRGWSRPMFTGLWTRPVFREFPPKSFRGMAVAEIKARHWITLFPDDSEIVRDTDGDDLTDIVEDRLGTDRARRDTDGDGLLDAVDPCPNAAPRPLSDVEQIVAAAVEAHFFERRPPVPALISVRGIAPFELYGYRNTVIWDTTDSAPSAKQQAPLYRVYGGGMNAIRFQAPTTNGCDDGCGDGGDEDKPFVDISKDGKTARTVITRYSGGLNGEGMDVRLMKIGGEWFVTDMRLVFVS